MIGRSFGKVMWLGRAVTFCVGLAVVLAVVLGVATTALAAVPGDPFKLGRLNVVDRLTTLTGNVSGPLLKVDNNGNGSALSLEAETGRPPLTVNAGAGKAVNLDADKLDGKDSSAFLPVGGKAASATTADTAGDSGTLDSKDSSDFLPVDGTAQDAGKVDGLDAYQFMRSATYYHRNTSVFSSDDAQTVTASCPRTPRQFMAISGGVSIVAPDSAGEAALAEVPVAVKEDRPEGRSSWVAVASETSPYDGEWAVKAHVVCVLETQSYYYPADAHGLFGAGNTEVSTASLKGDGNAR